MFLFNFFLTQKKKNLGKKKIKRGRVIVVKKLYTNFCLAKTNFELERLRDFSLKNNIDLKIKKKSHKIIWPTFSFGLERLRDFQGENIANGRN